MQNCADLRLGRFELVRELGRGLNSTVYLAQDPEIDRTVLIKLLDKEMFAPEDLSAWSRTISALSHVGIVKVFDLGYSEPAGDPFVVAEFVEGKPLEAVLAKGKLGEAEALALTLEFLDALSHAHSRGVWHHNLKPSNLIITSDGHIKVTDFGGIRRGSVTPFMAPERLKAPGDQRSDLFSVGVILYLMLSGFRPFQGNTDSTIGFKLVHQHPVPVAAMDLKLSPELDLVVGRFLAKNPDERYQSADEARRDISAIRDAKEAELSVSSGNVKAKTPTSLLDTMGIRSETASLSRPSALGHKRRAGTPWWQIGIPVGIGLIATAAIAITGPLFRSNPAPPVLNVHLDLPVARTETQPITIAPRKVKTRSVRASAATTSPTMPAVVIPDVVAMPIELRQPFQECLMSIWVDDKLAYQNRIRAEKKSRFLHLGTATVEYLTLVQIPTGKHSVRVELQGVGEDYEGRGSLLASFSKANAKRLRITADKSHPQLDLQLN